MVAVDTRDRVAIASGDRDIEKAAPIKGKWQAHLARRAVGVK
jgi:hypothetical protein